MSKTTYEIKTMKTVRTFMKTGSCAEGIMNVLNRAMDNPMEIEEHGVMPLAGGVAQQGYQCGLLWGASLAAGAQSFKQHGPGQKAEAAALTASQRVVERFDADNGEINCLELTDTDWKKKSHILKNFLKGGPITCLRLTARTAPIALEEIESALAQETEERTCCPGNCAAKLARKMGASDKHAAMAAGFAGGIGLSGGACGALGAAIWLVSMNCAENGRGYNTMNARAGELIVKFLESSDYEFECSEIVGRKFESIDDHGAHVINGGCAEIIEALAATGREMILEPQRLATAS